MEPPSAKLTESLTVTARPLGPATLFRAHPRLLFSRQVVGASGDLAKKKIFPSLFALYYEGTLPAVSPLSLNAFTTT